MDIDASLLEPVDARSTHRTVNGVRLHVVGAGDEDDPLVVLLHGFPDFWYGWRHQIRPLVEAGYRVVVPDQRGYNLSEAPRGLAAYDVGELAADVVDLLATEDSERAHVIGHDWGAIVAWNLALRHPDTVDTLGIINVPHPIVFQRTVTSNPRQLARSWYMLAFQLPLVPERLLGARHGVLLARALTESAAPGAFSRHDVDCYRSSWEAGSVTGMLNWYRAAIQRQDQPAAMTVEQPTLICWGERDIALLPEMAAASLDYCTDGDLERFPQASHWVHLEHPEQVTDCLLEHLHR